VGIGIVSWVYEGGAEFAGGKRIGDRAGYNEVGLDLGGLGEEEALSEETKGSLACFQKFEWRERYLNCGIIYMLQALLAQ